MSQLIVSLFIPSESPLADGRLPVDKQEVEGGWVVRLDPVSLAALLTSVGKPCSVLQAEQEIPAMANSPHQTEEDGESVPGDYP